MNTILQMTKKVAAATLLAASVSAYSQAVFYLETFGSPSKTTPVTSYTGYSVPKPVTYTGDADVRNTAASTTAEYSTASGGGNVFFTGTVGTNLLVSGIDSSKYQNIKLSFGESKSTNASTNELKVEVSADGMNWTALSYTRPSGNNTASKYQLIQPTGVIPSTSNLRIRFTNNSTTQWRVDDVQLTGDLIPQGVVSVKSGTWADPTTWNTGIIPLADDAVTIAAGTTVTAERAFIQRSGITVNGTLAMNEALTFNGDVVNNGKLIINNGAGLVQGTDSKYLGAGTVNIYRNANVFNDEYNLWSSPVNGFDMSKLYINGSTPQYILEYNTLTDYFVPTSPVAVAAKGFAVKGSPLAASDPAESNAMFYGTGTGILNNGIIASPSLKLGGAGNYNFIGNPYPSNMDLVRFYQGNVGVIGSTAYLWDNNETRGNSQHGSSYNGANYATFNMDSGIGLMAPSGTKQPSGYVTLGQGFLIEAQDERPVGFTNDMRDAANIAPFYNRSAGDRPSPAASKAVITDRYTIRLMTADNQKNDIVTAYDLNASNNVDNGDSQAVNPNAANLLYSFADNDPNKRLVIQARQAPFSTSDSYKLGVNLATAQTATLSIEKSAYPLVGVFAQGQPIYIYDKLNNTYFDLNSGTFSFTADAGSTADRFIIVYEKNVLANTEVSNASTTLVYKEGETFAVSSDKKIVSVEVYDMSGKVVYTAKPNAVSHKINAASFAKGVYMVKVNNGTLTVKKIIK